MNIWNDYSVIYNRGIPFTKIRYWKNGEDTGKLYITNGSDNGYIDLETGYFYWRDEVYNLQYEVYESSTPLQLDKRYGNPSPKNYRFWSVDVNPEVIKLQSSQLYDRLVRLVRPTDESQDWTRTEYTASRPNTSEDACQCSTIDRWIEDGEICDGVNRCKRYKYQWKYDCDSNWIDYTPLKYKVGEIIELDSPQCGLYDYREDWDNEICGSELNEQYGANVTKTNKYAIKKIFIKPVDGTEWEELQCYGSVEYELKKQNSFECGWVGYKNGEWTDICGNALKQIIPNLSLNDYTTYSKVKVYDYYKTAPYPVNTDDMEESDWTYVVNEKNSYSVSYSAKTTNDCNCGYYYLQWDDTDEYICGSELINNTEILYITNYNNGVIQDAYINTNIPITDDLYYRIKYRVRYASGGIFVGDIASPSDNDDYRFFFSSNYGFLDMENRRVSATTFGGTSTTYEMEIGSAYVKNLSTGSITGTTAYTIADRNRPLYIYAPYVNTTNNGCDGVDIYYFQIYNSTGLIRDFIPYEQDGVVGLYDNVENKFYSSDGDGQFVAVYDNDYVKTSQYRKQIECKYCSDNFIEETGNERWVVSDSKSCECGYREQVSETSYDYTYICGDDIDMDSGYMYYKKIVNTYSQCVDGSNKELVNTVESYLKASHSTSSVTTCEYDEDTQANTTKVVTKYRTYYDENDKSYKFVECPDRIVLEETTYKKSGDCGYKEEWINDGYICCGSLEFEKPLTMTITNTSGNWTRDGFVFTSNTITHSETTDMKIYFNVNRNCTLKISYDISSESGYDKFYYSNLDSASVSNGGFSGTKTGTVGYNVTQGEHNITLRYQKDGSQSSGRDNVIVTLSVEDTGGCTKFARYNKQYFRYSVDNGETWVTPEPKEYRYGSLVETNSEECGYVPTLEHWILICPDITYETAEADDGCVECQQYNNAPTMFAIEKKQRSYDRGVTWEDIYENGSLVTRTQQLLKWKADKCGYTGDTFEDRWTDTYCENGHLYGTKTTWVSSDGGKSWVEVEGTSRIEIKEENSSECDEGTE